jgi:hypothetical protein
MPLLTTQSAKSYGWGTLASSLAGDFQSIQTITVGSGGQATIEFTSIPSTYKHLHLRTSDKISRSLATMSGGIRIKFNSDSTTGNYFSQRLLSDGANPHYGNVYTGYSTGAYLFDSVGNGGPSQVFSSTLIDIFDYANTNAVTTVRTMGGGTPASGAEAYFFGGMWNSTAAVTTITLTEPSYNWVEGTTISLYGVKG